MRGMRIAALGAALGQVLLRDCNPGGRARPAHLVTFASGEPFEGVQRLLDGSARQPGGLASHTAWGEAGLGAYSADAAAKDEKEELRTSAGKTPAEDHDDFVARRLSVAHLDFGDDDDEK